MSQPTQIYLTFTLLLTILFTLPDVSYTANNPICMNRRYYCANSTVTNQEGVCVNLTEFRQKEHVLTSCAAYGVNSYCPYQQAAYGSPAYCTTPPAKNKTIPGDTCRYDGECLSGSCINRICQGNSANSSCTWHGDCNIGLFCNASGICEAQRNFGSACNSSEECTNNCACSRGLCFYYYTLDTNIAADNGMVCASGYIVNNTCAPARISNSKGRPCDTDSECTTRYPNGTVSTPSQCQCGYNGGGFTYCSLVEGDSEFQTALVSMQYILAYSYQCHTLHRYGPCKYIPTQEYLTYKLMMMKFKYYSQLVYNDQCVKDIYNPDYWALYTQVNDAVLPFRVTILLTVASTIILSVLM